MLWKYKKCYTETSEDIQSDCIYIESLIYTNTENLNAEITITATDCIYNNTSTATIPVGNSGLGCTLRNSIIEVIWADLTTTSINVNLLPVTGTFTVINPNSNLVETLVIEVADYCNDAAICTGFTLVATTPTNITFTYNDCKDGTTTIIVPGEKSIDVCAYSVETPTNSPTQWSILLNENNCS